MRHQTHSYLTIRIIFLTILLISCLSVQARPVIALSTSENAFVQDISIQVLKKAYDKLGYQIEINKLPNVRSLLLANMGEFDGEVSRIGNLKANYENLNAVPTAINTINVIALGNEESERITKVIDLANDVVVCVTGIKLVEKLVKTNGIHCSFVVNINQALSMVSLGRARYALLPETNARKALSAQPLETVKVVSPILHSEKLYHYLHKNNLKILEPLDAVLREMQSNGDIEQIRARFLDQNL